MYLQWLKGKVRENNWEQKEFMLWEGKSYNYAWLFQQIGVFFDQIKANNVEQGCVCALFGDYSPYSVALFLALIENKNLIVPVSTEIDELKNYYCETAEVEFVFVLDKNGEFTIRQMDTVVRNQLLVDLRQQRSTGLVLFTSGSTGNPKAALYDFDKLLDNYQVVRKAMRSLVFLHLDHIGGINTLFSMLSNGGTMVILKNRNPSSICTLIEKYRVELFPTTPSFLNLLKVSEVYKEHDLSSLKMITYGTEVMPESLLKSLTQIFPGITFKQTYGLTEVGILRSKSKSNDSLWVKVGGEHYQTRVVDGVLWIKADSATRGYLNAPSPFTEDGWLITRDKVEVDGEFVKFLGREEEIINVGGLKVYPAEVEDVLLQIDNVSDVIVGGEKNPMLGNIVCAKVILNEYEDLEKFRKRLYAFCINKLERFKIPQKIEITNDVFIGAERFKKIRKKEPCELEK